MSVGLPALAIASLAASAAGTVVSVMGARQQAKAQAASARYQAGVARNNQIIANRKAEDARKRGSLEAAQQGQKTRLLRSQQEAALAGAGVLLGQDSALDLVESTSGLGRLDALTIESNAEREALGFEAQGMNFQAEAGLQDAQAGFARDAGRIAVGRTLLSGFGSVSKKWYGFRQDGVL